MSAPETKEQEESSNTGSIELIIGPMFGGKSSEMISRVRRATHAMQAGCIIKFKGDDRYEHGDTVSTHDDVRQSSTPGTDMVAPIRVISAATLSEVDVTEPVIGVDEGQFYPDLLECCEAWARDGHRVIIAALDGDFNRKPFGQVCQLIPLCEKIVKQQGVCMACRTHDSAFTQRLWSGSDSVIKIGGNESYRSVCRKCYFDSGTS